MRIRIKRRFAWMRRAEKQSNIPFDPRDIDYSRRWLAAGWLTLAGCAAALLRAEPEERGPLLRRMLAVAGIGGGASLLAGVLGTTMLQLEHQSFEIPGLDPAWDGVRIAQLTDLHLGPWYANRNWWRARAWLAVEQPDMIVLSGDFVGKPEKLPLLAEHLQGLRAPLGVWACLGNHDYYGGPAEIASLLEELGITVLVNEHRVVERAGAPLVIAGVASPRSGAPNLEAALAGADPALPVLLLSHVPDLIEVAAGERVVLQLSGHVHGGHAALPLLGPLMFPPYGKLYPSGRYQVGPTWLYTSRGLGGRPLRIGALPEATIHTLRGVER
jgi:predicted MPP superfamily phosphohydrolase